MPGGLISWVAAWWAMCVRCVTGVRNANLSAAWTLTLDVRSSERQDVAALHLHFLAGPVAVLSASACLMTSRGRRVHHVNAALTATGWLTSSHHFCCCRVTSTKVCTFCECCFGSNCTIAMPADIRSFFGGGPPKASQGSEGSQKKEEVCVHVWLVQLRCCKRYCLGSVHRSYCPRLRIAMCITSLLLSRPGRAAADLRRRRNPHQRKQRLRRVARAELSSKSPTRTRKKRSSPAAPHPAVTSKTPTDSCQAQESDTQESCAEETQARTYTRA